MEINGNIRINTSSYVENININKIMTENFIEK